jgi:hypothetical protein
MRGGWEESSELIYFSQIFVGSSVSRRRLLYLPRFPRAAFLLLGATGTGGRLAAVVPAMKNPERKLFMAKMKFVHK